MSEEDRHGPGALPMAPEIESNENEEDEWEYEYSNTETEVRKIFTIILTKLFVLSLPVSQVYYLTVELSYPEFRQAPTNSTQQSSRSSYYKNWGQELDDASFTAKPSHEEGINDDLIANDINQRSTNENEATQSTDTTLDPKGKGKGVNKTDGEREDNEKSKREKEGSDDIQILELHSDKPIISYRGQVFQGEWAEVIGSEAILARHSPGNENTLPVLRNLAGDVDLLAASASRILTRKVELKPRETPQEDIFAPVKEAYNINIPKGKGKSGERRQQAAFLENLIALKLARGDKDSVTVFAKEGFGKDFQDAKDPDRKPPAKRRTRLPQTRKEGGRSGRPRGSGRAKRFAKVGAASLFGQVTPDSLSTPTPNQWKPDTEGGPSSRPVVGKDQEKKVHFATEVEDLGSDDREDEEDDYSQEDEDAGEDDAEDDNEEREDEEEEAEEEEEDNDDDDNDENDDDEDGESDDGDMLGTGSSGDEDGDIIMKE